MNTAPVCDLHELETIQLNTISENGKRFYTDDAGEIKYPSVTTVTGLLNREHIKLWRERVGAEEANKITKKATTRGTKFHQHVEDYEERKKKLSLRMYCKKECLRQYNLY